MEPVLQKNLSANNAFTASWLAWGLFAIGATAIFLHPDGDLLFSLSLLVGIAMSLTSIVAGVNGVRKAKELEASFGRSKSMIGIVSGVAFLAMVFALSWLTFGLAAFGVVD